MLPLSLLRQDIRSAKRKTQPQYSRRQRDSAEDASVFFARELDHVKAQSYDVEYPELTALHLFPQSSEADPGAETITYYTYDKTGLAKIIDNYSTDLPRADVTGKPSFAKIKSIGDSYG
ncbi:hypothetical protein L0P50_16425 [Lawsonibacter sp. DFI.6.74]|nr:hypothetical protein [Lawsonibacter sp. DFI.6.74]